MREETGLRGCRGQLVFRTMCKFLEALQTTLRLVPISAVINLCPVREHSRHSSRSEKQIVAAEHGDANVYLSKHGCIAA